MSDGMSNVKHVVVLMLENRSFDNMVGYVYADQDNKPAVVIPPGSSPTYNGLAFFPPGDPSNPFWNPTDKAFYSGKPSERIYVTRETEDDRFLGVPNVGVRRQRTEVGVLEHRVHGWRSRSCCVLHAMAGVRWFRHVHVGHRHLVPLHTH